MSLEYWTIKGLSCVASAIGIPFQADHTTLLRKRLSYARVCVEIDASKTLVKEYDLRCPNGLLITILADHEWIPSKCNNCNISSLDRILTELLSSTNTLWT